MVCYRVFYQRDLKNIQGDICLAILFIKFILDVRHVSEIKMIRIIKRIKLYNKHVIKGEGLLLSEPVILL